MTKDGIFNTLREILVQEFEIDEEMIRPEAELLADLEFDSIDAVDLIVKMKPHVTGKIDPELFKNARTIADVVDILFPLV